MQDGQAGTNHCTYGAGLGQPVDQPSQRPQALTGGVGLQTICWASDHFLGFRPFVVNKLMAKASQMGEPRIWMLGFLDLLMPANV